MIGFSNTSWVSSPSRTPKPPPKPLKMSEHKSATVVDPPPYKKKRQEESEENKGIESKKAAPKSTNPRTIPVSSALSRHYSSIKKHVLRSSRGQQISPKPQPTAVAPTHKRGVSSTFKKEDSDSNILKKPKPAKSVIPGTGSKSAATRRVTSTRAAALVNLDSNVTEQESPKPLKTTEPVTKKRQEKSVGEKGLESPTATAKPIIPGSKSQATRSTPTSAAPSPRSSSVESSPLHSNTSSPRDSKIEKHLPNGDLYIGCFSRNFPHGTGKYLWKDGSMYEGEWKRGKATGKGKYSWPSGASFEGEFKSGRREGSGAFIGPGGDRYKGTWLADQKHGHGVKYYCNGDYYEGHWRKNLQDGQGQYVCENGNQYVGEWKNGVINGKGELVWANGNRYQGNWENGVPTENGVVTWPDGSRYIGSWVRDGKNHRNQVLKGTFFPSHSYSGSLEAGSERFGGKVVAVGTSKKRSSVDGGGRGSAVERNFSSIRIWESDAEAGNITGDIIDTVETSMMYGDVERDNQKQLRWRNSCSFSGEMKRPGMTISKDHKNYDLMLSLQLGIRHSVEKDASNFRGLGQSDYDPKEKFWTRFPLEGSKSTPPHQSADFRWKDYCPMVFRHLRRLFHVDPDDYMLSICGSDSLREFSSPGKSGSSFYLTQDDRFIIKTVKKSEVKVLIKMLRSYHDHVCRYENSLLTKFYGVHCVKPVGGTKTRFIVMGNLFSSEYRIHRRFDLKGSSHGRATDKAGCMIDETTTFKDLDLNYAFWLQEKSHGELIKQIERDCEFLEAEKIMDYSFLVGMHFHDNNAGDNMGLSPVHVKTGESISYQDLDRIRSGRKPLIRLGANMPATAERVACKSGFGQCTPGEIREVVLYFGIIDMLQDYDIGKKLEHAYKSLQVDPTSISVVNPKLYSKRFQNFIGRIFRPDRCEYGGKC